MTVRTARALRATGLNTPAVIVEEFTDDGVTTVAVCEDPELRLPPPPEDVKDAQLQAVEEWLGEQGYQLADDADWQQRGPEGYAITLDSDE